MAGSGTRKNNCGENSEYQSMEKHVIPVGYQPFNRCRSQHAYMVLGIQDLYLDAQFDKAKFLLDEDFCEWIYEEMGKGEKYILIRMSPILPNTFQR